MKNLMVDPTNPGGPFGGGTGFLGMIAYFLLLFAATGNTMFGDAAHYLLSLQ